MRVSNVVQSVDLETRLLGFPPLLSVALGNLQDLAVPQFLHIKRGEYYLPNGVALRILRSYTSYTKVLGSAVQFGILEGELFQRGDSPHP